MAEDDFDDDVMTDADFEAALDELRNGETEEISELLKLMNEHQIISWEEAERILGDTSDVPIKSSLPPQTRPSEPENDTNVNDTIQKLLQNDPKLTQINLNNMKRTPVPQIKRIIEAMRENKHIEKLCLANMGLYDHDIAGLIDVLQVNESLKSINVETNYLGGDFFSGLFRAALTNETLEEVKCVNQGVSFATDKEKEIIKAVQQNTGLLKVSINLRLPEGRHKIENALIRNQDIRRELRRRQRAAEQAAAAQNPEEPKKEEKVKGVAPYIPGGANPGPPKRKIIDIPPPKTPEKVKPPPKKLITELPKKMDLDHATPPAEPLKVYRRPSTVSQSDQNESPTSSNISSPIKKTAKEPAPAKAEEPSFGKFPVLEKKPQPPAVPKKKEIPPVEKKNPTPMGVFPRNRIPSSTKKLTEEETSRVNSANNNRTDESESERERDTLDKNTKKSAVNDASSAAPSDAELKPKTTTTDGEEEPKKKKKIIKKRIVVKKVVKKKKKAASEDESGAETAHNATSQAEESDRAASRLTQCTDTESEIDSRPSSKLKNHQESESEDPEKADSDSLDPDGLHTKSNGSSAKVPPPVLPKTTRVSDYSGYTPSASGYNNSRFGGYNSSRYSRY